MKLEREKTVPNSHVVIPTAHASKYLKQMCKHFAHKVEVDFDDFRAHVAFPPGPCQMNADASELVISCQSDSEKGIEVMQSIIDQHIVKFAWREDLKLNWIAGERLN